MKEKYTREFKKRGVGFFKHRDQGEKREWREDVRCMVCVDAREETIRGVIKRRDAEVQRERERKEREET